MDCSAGSRSPLLAYALSKDRRAVPWRIVAGGPGLQVALAALLVTVVPARDAVLPLVKGQGSALDPPGAAPLDLPP